MTKHSAFGIQLKRGATTVAGVKSVSGPGLKVDTEDVTSHDSPGGWEEVVATILRSGEIKVEIEYDPAGATHKNEAGGLLYDLSQRAGTAYSIVFPVDPVVTWSFTAFVIGFEPNAPVDGALTATVTLKITGAPTLA